MTPVKIIDGIPHYDSDVLPASNFSRVDYDAAIRRQFWMATGIATVLVVLFCIGMVAAYGWMLTSDEQIAVVMRRNMGAEQIK